MGHSDRIVVTSGNFPAESTGRDAHVVHMKGHGVPRILEAILSLFPLDAYIEHSICLMLVADGGTVEAPIWDQYMILVEACNSRGRSAIGHIGRFAFYEKAKRAYVITATSEKTFYANIMLQEGIVTDQDL